MKKVVDSLYFHKNVIDSPDFFYRELFLSAFGIVAHLAECELFDLFKINLRSGTVSFLKYDCFSLCAFPRLRSSLIVNVHTRSFVSRSYVDSPNPPILHRKELFCCGEQHEMEAWIALTKNLEAIGAFDEPLTIGYQVQWDQSLERLGYTVIGHDLIPLANECNTSEDDGATAQQGGVKRHLTALTRYALSAPVQQLLRFGLLSKDDHFFDYGCGRGDDLRSLSEAGYSVTGWDPHYASESELRSADVVNLGFVLNVIEDPFERAYALKRAFSLASKVLAVGVMVANENKVAGTPFADGVLTTRNTFQKYFSQNEFIHYLNEHTVATPYPVAPGICLLFKSELVEQEFTLSRQTTRSLSLDAFVRRRRVEHRVSRPYAKAEKVSVFEAKRELLDKLWEVTLTLGREPLDDEVPFIEAVNADVGSLRRALKLNAQNQSEEELKRAAKQRRADLLVHFALERFRKRSAFHELPSRLRADVKCFFGSLKVAEDLAFQLLNVIADVEAVWESARTGATRGVGYLDESTDQYYFESENLNHQDPVIRAIVGCAAALFGDRSSCHLIKVHVRSSKVSFLSYDDFYGSAIPYLVQRVKVSLKSLRMDVFSYEGEFVPIPLLDKSKFMSESHVTYSEQILFDETLRGDSCWPLISAARTRGEIESILAQQCLQIDGLRLSTAAEPPEIDAPCGRFLTFRDFFLCGETQKATGVFNLPAQMETYRGYIALAVNVIDPVIEYFGSIVLTYGFCGAKLRPLIKRRVAHDRDQHAGHELKRTGGLVCERGGAACDFFVEDEDMLEVARWVAENTPFDRLYFYGSDRPIHVSYRSDPEGVCYQMLLSDSEKLYPKSLKFKTDSV